MERGQAGPPNEGIVSVAPRNCVHDAQRRPLEIFAPPRQRDPSKLSVCNDRSMNRVYATFTGSSHTVDSAVWLSIFDYINDTVIVGVG